MTEKTFLLAPMAEISHRAVRELVAGFGGCDEYFSEMISAGALMSGGQYESWYLDNAPAPEKFVYQLVSGNVEHLARAASFLEQYECAGVDINMGCSAPSIVRAGGGVQWMSSIDKAGGMIAHVRKGTSRRLSVKLRIGFFDDFDYLASFCKRLEAEGVERITLHPRTAKEKFKRGARWEYVKMLRNHIRIPVAGNGDILSAEEMNRRSFECDAVMIGRLAAQKPWSFALARGLPLPGMIDLEAVAVTFLDMLVKYQPPEFHKSRAQRFFAYFCSNLKWANHVRTLLGRETELTAMRHVLERFFRENPEERYVSGGR
ncbi:MAG: tRNA-dihydrouridine synthase family protein [Treponema sp.]|jgi:tRNA-dihydrouridine synthase|nr:tRNA-dihydrouridine synthase family protein [Treponema sp.]